MAVTGYCLKCKDQKEIKDAQAITMKNGKPATTGTCPTCGTKIFKIGKAFGLTIGGNAPQSASRASARPTPAMEPTRSPSASRMMITPRV